MTNRTIAESFDAVHAAVASTLEIEQENAATLAELSAALIRANESLEMTRKLLDELLQPTPLDGSSIAIGVAS
jgi:hypothetical protein